MIHKARSRRQTVIIMGMLSAVLYGSVALMPAFLVPLQTVGARKGYRAMLLSSGLSGLAIVAWQTLALVKAGAMQAGPLLLGISVPLCLILALIVMATPRLGRLSFASRTLLGAALASSISLPAIFYALEDPGVRALFIEAFEKASSVAGAGTLRPELLWTALRTGVASSYAAILFVFLFASAWLGSRFGSNARFGGTVSEVPDMPFLPPALRAYRVPSSLVWALLASWAGLLLNRFFPSVWFSAAALNVALALSICYGVQGFAVAGALAERVGLAPALRILGPLALILLLASGVAGLVAIALLALLGTLETWIPFRAATKGDLP